VAELRGTTASHPPVLDAAAVKAVGAPAVTARLCVGAGEPPRWYEKETVAGATVTVGPEGPEPTVSVTASVCDPFDDPFAATVTLPV